ncbi:hypothetical protein D9M68_454890 [compost metagenome]
MGQVFLEQLQCKPTILDLSIGPGHFIVGPRHIQEKRQDRSHYQQADSGCDHQLDQAESRLPPATATSGRNAANRYVHVIHRFATRTMVVTTRRQRSFWQTAPVAPL